MSGASFRGCSKPVSKPVYPWCLSRGSFGAAIGLVLELPAIGIQGLSFLFGLLAVAITYFLSHIYRVAPIDAGAFRHGCISFFQAMLSLVKFAADDEEKLPAITFWLMGSLGSVNLHDLAIAVIPLMGSIILLYLLRWKINVLSMGDREARALGINNELLKALIIVSTTIITSSSVAFCGIIGWVGQVIPTFAG